MSEPEHRGLSALNSLAAPERERMLFACCSSTAFARRVSARAPFRSVDSLLAIARIEAEELTRDDWLEAFSHHPRIGDRAALARRVEGAEQAGMRAASDDITERMIRGNEQYERRYGHIYLVCAAGRSAEELLAILEARLENDPATEFQNACNEQRAITELRLGALLERLADKDH